MKARLQLINTVLASLNALPDFQEIAQRIAEAQDASIALSSIMRPSFVAAQFLRAPRPTLLVCENELVAEQSLSSLTSYLEENQIFAFPKRSDEVLSDVVPNLSINVQRSEAIYRLAAGEPVVVVASLASLMRMIPANSFAEFAPLRLEVGAEIEPAQAAKKLIDLGYERKDRIEEEGDFSLKGDVLDIFAPLGRQSLRVEFFGDEVESIKKLVPSSSQTINTLESAELFALRELFLNPESRSRASRALEKPAFSNQLIAYHRRLIEEGVYFAGIERYLNVIAEKTATLPDYLKSDSLVYVSEPQTLFKLALAEYEKAKEAAKGADLSGLIAAPAEINFGSGARVTFASTLETGYQFGSGSAAKAEFSLIAKRPQIAGSDERLVAKIKSYVATGYATILSLPTRRIRERIIDLIADAGIPMGEGFGQVAVLDLDLPLGFEIAEAKLVVISQSDAFPRSVKTRTRKADIDSTKITFPFNPGDYVVHANYGIALFKEVVRREVDGVQRDYLHLAYAEGDALFTPVDQIDKITKYVGPDSSAPKVTRLGTKSWARATQKARAAAKKLAFDIVNLYARRSQVKGYRYGEDSLWQAEMEAAFQFEETPDQLEAIADVKADMESDKPMDRLICGDVGYGKTEVAIRAAFKAVQEDKQVMVLCPTTILAQQHFTNFSERFKPFNIEVEVLSRFRTPAQQRKAVEGFADGRVQVLIGTHRLLSKDISPKDLGLLVIDEEQRFGVEHKEKLKNMRENIDVLAMSATPIPRTLQMSLSGVRDLSIIDTPPKNRFPVRVRVGELNDDAIEHAINFELERKGQVYYVSNRVRTIEDAYARVQKAAPTARIGMAHGQMGERELEAVMEAFVAGEIDVLVATTIVESGIDNPHSNTLIIEDSHRLGLAQLYQLKGRVGRSHVHAFAYFMYPADADLTSNAIERLQAIAEHDSLGSGIKIAMRDLEIRGAGSILGAEQSGQMSAVGFDLFAGMIGEAVSEAKGEEQLAFPDIRIDLPDPAFFADEYIEDIEQRILLYRRIAGLATRKGVEELQKEVETRYGALPQAAQNLFTLALVKVLAAEVKAEALSVSGAYILVKMKKPAEDVLGELKMIGALYDERTARLRWKIPYGESMADAARILLAAIVFDS